jgi:uncharacterized protein YndB with AHSA1/START domain
MSVEFNTFSISREYPVAPALVFAAFADPARKAAWTNPPDGDGSASGPGYDEFDVRIGGRERFEFKEEDGRTMSYDAHYYDVVPGERLVYAYEMYQGDDRISVSVATIQLESRADGTVLTWTEQGAYLDDLDKPDLREGGTSWMLDNLLTYFA